MPEIIPNWHPILVHFTFALLFLSPFFFAIALFGKGQTWNNAFTIAGRAFLWTGVLITTLTVWAGFSAMEEAHGNVSHQLHQYIHEHRNWAIATAVSFILLASWSFVNWRRNVRESGLLVLLLFAATGSLTMTGYKGGELVFRHGIGVLPHTNANGHNDAKANSEPPSPDQNQDHNH